MELKRREAQTGHSAKFGTPKSDSWQVKTVTLLSYAAPVGVGVSKILLSDVPLPQVLFLIATPLAVYLEKTWSKRRETEAKERRTQQEGFFRSYTECLETAIKTVQTAGELSAPDIRRTQQEVLKLVCNIVELFLGKPDGVVINASVMRAEPLGGWKEGTRLKNVLFASSTRLLDAYRCVLHLTVWAAPPNAAEKVALPVAANNDILLFGAPRAFVHGTMEYVADTQCEELIAELVARQDDDVRDDIKKYLKRWKENFVSFISAPVKCSAGTQGVLNVQSNQPEILGPHEIYRADLQQCLLPFCALLGTLIALENKVDETPLPASDVSQSNTS
jgi:hypothetical protein